MRHFSSMTDKERESIIKQHSQIYDGYATLNTNSNMTPLTVYDAAKDKTGSVVNIHGVAKPYTNHKINEITAKPLNYDEIQDPYTFYSGGPNQSMSQPNPGKPPFNFKSKGPVDVYEFEENEETDEGMMDLNDINYKEQGIEKKIKESINRAIINFVKNKY